MIDKKPVILMMNDLHIGKETIQDFRLNFEEAIQVCNKYDIKHLCIGGDMFQSRASQTLSILLTVKELLNECANKHEIQVSIIEGNHDKVDQEKDEGYCHLFDTIPGVHVAKDYFTLRSESDDWNFVLHMLGYYPENGSFSDKLKGLIKSSLDPIKKNYLYIHEGINGALAQESDNELPSHIFKDFDKVFVGHYHNRTKIDGTNIEYIGSSRQHNFGEDEEKGYTIIFSDSSTQFIKNTVNVRYKNIDIPFDKMGVMLLDEIDELKHQGYKVKVKIRYKSEQVTSVNKQEILTAGASKVEIVQEELEETNVQQSVFVKFDKSGIKTAYEEFCESKSIDDVETGIKYLSKI